VVDGLAGADEEALFVGDMVVPAPAAVEVVVIVPCELVAGGEVVALVVALVVAVLVA
jgi:hypothetical protein